MLLFLLFVIPFASSQNSACSVHHDPSRNCCFQSDQDACRQREVTECAAALPSGHSTRQRCECEYNNGICNFDLGCNFYTFSGVLPQCEPFFICESARTNQCLYERLPTCIADAFQDKRAECACHKRADECLDQNRCDFAGFQYSESCLANDDTSDWLEWDHWLNGYCQEALAKEACEQPWHACIRRASRVTSDVCQCQASLQDCLNRHDCGTATTNHFNRWKIRDVCPSVSQVARLASRAPTPMPVQEATEAAERGDTSAESVTPDVSSLTDLIPRLLLYLEVNDCDVQASLCDYSCLDPTWFPTLSSQCECLAQQQACLNDYLCGRGSSPYYADVEAVCSTTEFALPSQIDGDRGEPEIDESLLVGGLLVWQWIVIGSGIYCCCLITCLAIIACTLRRRSQKSTTQRHSSSSQNPRRSRSSYEMHRRSGSRSSARAPRAYGMYSM